MPYIKTTWENGGGAPINANNLNNIENGIEQLYDNLSAFGTYTLDSDSWVGSSPSTYDLNGQIIILSNAAQTQIQITDAHNLTVAVSPSATADQYNAFGAAKICGSADSNTLTALGVRPTIDIPVIVKVVTK